MGSNFFTQDMEKLLRKMMGRQLLKCQTKRMVGRERKGAKAYFLYRPDLGIPIFDHDPRAAMEIPLKIVIWEGPDGKAIIRYKKPSSLFGNFEKLHDLGNELDKLMVKISDAGMK